MQRCIQCGRCIRACSDIRGVEILGYNKKNGETYVGTKFDLSLKESDCRFCGACVEVCATGALRDVEGIFSKDSPKEIAYIPCKNTCPANVDIPSYVRLVSEGKNSEAVGIIREKVPFPLSLGYVCTNKCEDSCRRHELNSSISIRNLKRFAVDHDTTKVWKEKALQKKENTGKKVAVIGAGPSGLTAAYYISKKGHSVDVYEKLPVAGGMMSVGIPEYRLNSDVIKSEVDFIKDLGVKIITNQEIKNINDLKHKGYDAILIAIGTHMGKKLNIEGNDCENVYSAVEFLKNINLKKDIDVGEKVVILGGGNVAFDCARTSRRLCAKKVEIICIEPRNAMLADNEEIKQAEEEGITILNSKTTLSLEGNNNNICGVKCIDVEKFSFDENGKLNLKTIEGTEAVIKTDTVVFATGQAPMIDESFGIGLTKRGFVDVNFDSLKTDSEGVYACGDTIYGTKSVIEAIASGRKAAESIDIYLGGDGDINETIIEIKKPDDNIGKRKGFAYEDREEPEIIDASNRLCGFCKVDLGFDKDKAQAEAKRCLQCDLRLNISKVKFWADYDYR